MTQTQNQCFKSQIPKHVVEFLEELGLSVKQARKCVDKDFMTMLSAVLLADGKVFDYRIYSVADNWRILHIWMPDIGSDMALIVRFRSENGDYELEECFMIEEE